MTTPLRILHVEDSPADAALIAATIEAAGLACAITRVDNREALLAALEREPPDVVLCDYSMPAFDGMTALALVRARRPEMPFIFVSGTIGEERAIEALRAGATDYLLKDRPARLPAAIRRALRDVQDRARRREAEERLRFLAYFDPLTGLPNRAQFFDRLAEGLASSRGEGGRGAVLLVKLARVTDITNTLGHHAGDRLIRDVGRRLRDALAEEVCLARVGEDDFGLFLRAGPEAAGRLAEAVHQALVRPFDLEGFAVEVEARVGIALAPEHADEGPVLLRQADVAQCLAKRQGMGTALYRPDQDPFQPERLALVGELRQALAGGRLRLHYQPKADLVTGALRSVEALVRWDHPQRGPLSPGLFIPIAEQTGLIKPLTWWAIEEALRAHVAWREAGHEVPVAVNLSARSLHDPGLSAAIARCLEEAGVGPDRLILELTESSVMADPVHAQQQLTLLHEMGVTLAVDDFGTGYSSLAYLKRLPVQELKIDKSFVQGLMTDRSDGAIVRAAVDLSHTLGLRVVAEGIEDQQTQHGLVALGCDEGQGYFIGRPVPAPDLLARLRDRPNPQPAGRSCR